MMWMQFSQNFRLRRSKTEAIYTRVQPDVRHSTSLFPISTMHRKEYSKFHHQEAGIPINIPRGTAWVMRPLNKTRESSCLNIAYLKHSNCIHLCVMGSKIESFSGVDFANNIPGLAAIACDFWTSKSISKSPKFTHGRGLRQLVHPGKGRLPWAVLRRSRRRNEQAGTTPPLPTLDTHRGWKKPKKK